MHPNESPPVRQERYDATFQMMSWWDSEVVENAKVMVVGAGALGNEVLKNLALMNVGNILIVDFDTIEYSNLCRSVLFRPGDVHQNKLKSHIAGERIKAINPNIKVKCINGDIGNDVGLGLIRRMDVVIGCLDNRIARLFINQLCFKVGKTWIDGAIENLNGQLNVYEPSKPCFECQLNEKEWEIIRYRMGCADVAQRNANAGKIPTTPLSASIIGAMQVQEAIKVIHNNQDQLLRGQRFVYHGMNNQVMTYKMGGINPNCDSHVDYNPEDIVEAADLHIGLSVRELLERLEKRFGTKEISIELDHEIVLELVGKQSEVSHEVLIAKPHLSEDTIKQYQAVPLEALVLTKTIDVLDQDFPKMDARLSDIGIPPLQILTVQAGETGHLVELTGDLSFLTFE